MSEVNEVNVPLLRKAVEWAEAEAAKPWTLRQWRQQDWITNPKKLALQTRDSLGRFVKGGKVETKDAECGTCYCIAGWVATQVVGAEPVDATYWSAIVTTPEGKQDKVPVIAMKELGLNWRQADRLFAATNTIEKVREIAESIAGERL